MGKYRVEMEVDPKFPLVLSAETDDFRLALGAYYELACNTIDERTTRIMKEGKEMDYFDIKNEEKTLEISQ